MVPIKKTEKDPESEKLDAQALQAAVRWSEAHPGRTCKTPCPKLDQFMDVFGLTWHGMAMFSSPKSNFLDPAVAW